MRRRAIFHGLVVGGLIFCAYLFVIVAPAHGFFGYDAWSYWTLNLAAPYRGPVGDLGFFPYSPAAALAISPLTALPWPVFVVVWWSLLIGALVWIGRRDLLRIVTGAIAGISFLLMPSQCAQWIAAVEVSAANPPVWPAL